MGCAVKALVPLSLLTLSAALGAGNEETSIFKKFTYAYKNKLDDDSSFAEADNQVELPVVGVDEFNTVLNQALGNSYHITFTLYKNTNPQEEQDPEVSLIHRLTVDKICIEATHDPEVPVTRRIRMGNYLLVEWPRGHFDGHRYNSKNSIYGSSSGYRITQDPRNGI